MKINIDEAIRITDKNAFMVYYDYALTYRNYIFKIRELIKCNSDPQNLYDELIRFETELRNDELKIISKHFKNHDFPEE